MHQNLITLFISDNVIQLKIDQLPQNRLRLTRAVRMATNGRTLI